MITKLKIKNCTALAELCVSETVVQKFQKQRYIELLNAFRFTFPSPEVEVFSSPGRTEIGGNHTDHNYGCLLAGAVNLDNIAVAAPNNSNTVHIFLKGYPAYEVDLTNLKPDESKYYTSSSLIRGICARLKELGYQTGGFDACIDDGVPKGSGLSSSASFEVLIGAIFCHLFNGARLDPIQNGIIG